MGTLAALAVGTSQLALVLFTAFILGAGLILGMKAGEAASKSIAQWWKRDNKWSSLNPLKNRKKEPVPA